MGMEIDPTEIPSLMTPEQYEWWILFGICVAGKSAKQTEQKLNALLIKSPFLINRFGSPFTRIRYMIAEKDLDRNLRQVRMEQYRRISKAFRAVVKIEPWKLKNVATLEGIPGIGPKTARMLVLYSDPAANCVPLDTHILKYLKAQGIPSVPKSTPAAGPIYRRLEAEFQNLALSQRKTVRQLNTEVWKSYAIKS